MNRRTSGSIARRVVFGVVPALVLVLVLVGCAGTESSDSSPPQASSSGATSPSSSVAGLDPDEDTSDHTAVNASIDRLLGDHTEWEDTIKGFRSAVADGEAEEVAALVRYPLRTIVDGSPTMVADADEFAQRYEAIISSEMTRTIAIQHYADLVVSQEGVTFDGGVASVNIVCLDDSCTESEVLVVAVQPAA